MQQEVLTRQAVHAAHVARRIRMRSYTVPDAPRAPAPVVVPVVAIDYHVEKQHNDHVLRYWRRWRPRHADISVEAIVRACAEHYGVDADDVTGPPRHAAVMNARQVAAYLVRDMTTHSLLGAARRLCRDHSSVLKACEKIARLVAAGALPEVAVIRARLLAERDLTPQGE